MTNVRMTPQEYIDGGYLDDWDKSADELIVTPLLTSPQAAAVIAFMTGSNGLCLSQVASPKGDDHIFFAALREARKGKTPEPAPCEGKTVEIDGVTYKLVTAK